MPKIIEKITVQLRNSLFFQRLNEEGMVYGSKYGYGPDHEVSIYAVKGYAMDWAAYMDMPSGSYVTNGGGQKILHTEAARLFPAWEEGPLEWRD